MVDRRQDVRFEVSCRVKLRCDQSGLRFITGQTRNMSAGGALVELEHPGLLLPGQRVQMVVAWEPHVGLVRAEQMIEAIVVRSLRHGDTQYLALRYSHRQPLAEAI